MARTYRTADLSLVGYLLIRGFGLARVDKQKSKVIFLFEDQEELRGEIEEFKAGRARVDPIEYFGKLEAVLISAAL